MTGSMRGRARWCTAIVTLAFALSFARAEDLFRPTFVSEVGPPDQNVILPLLKAACGEGVRTVTTKGRNAFGCGDASMNEILASRHGTRPYPWMPYVLWEADGVIFGHFLSPTSEDAAINCFGCESHPSLFGGTLLLTKKAGDWIAVWYMSGIITRHCRRVSLATGRQILFCEATDGGMGHSFHMLYTVDFTTPQFAWDSVVLMADSYNSLMHGGVQTQSIDRVSFEETGQSSLLVRVHARHGRIDLRPDYNGERLPKPKLSNYEVDFRLDGEVFKVTRETSSSAKLFGVRSR